MKRTWPDKRLYFLGALIVVIMMLYVVGIDRYVTVEGAKYYTEIASHWVHSHYLLAVLGYITIYAVEASVMLPFGIALTVGAGYIFGTYLATLYTLAAIASGAALSFMLVRYLVWHPMHKAFNG